MRKFVKKILSVLIGAALTTTALPAASVAAYAEGTSESGSAAASGLTLSPVVLNYSLTNSKGQYLASISENIPFVLKMTIKDIKVKTSEITGIDFIKTVDSFKGTVESVNITSSGDDLLRYDVTIKDCKWSGGDTSFGFMVGYTGGSDYYSGSVGITECKASDSSGGGETVNIAEPTIKITGVEPSAPIRAGETGEFKIKLKNLSANSAYNILAEITPSDDILIVEGTGTQDIYNLDCKEEEIITIKYKALDKINSERQNFGVTLKFYYDNGTSECLGNASAQIAVAAEISTVKKVYPVISTEFSMSEAVINADKEYSGVVTIKNSGTADIKGLFVNFTASDDIVITDGTASRYFEELPMNSQKQITVKFRTMKELSSIRQNLGIALKYNYVMGSEELEGSYETSFVMFGEGMEAAPLPVISADPMDEPLTAGKKYRKAFFITNKGSRDMKNITVNVKGSEGLTITNGKDQFFVDSIKAGGQKRILVYFDTNAELTSVNQTLSVDLEYYYEKNGILTADTKSGTITMNSEISSAPVLRISGEKLESAIVPDTEYEYTISVKNYGDITVRDVFIDFTATDAFYFLDGTESGYIDIIRPQDTAEITVKFKTLEDITSVKQGITADMKYSYGRNSSIVQTNGTSSIVLIAAANKGADGKDSAAAPNIIIGKYDIGADQIAAGEVFDLALDFFNTSADTSIENVVMTINAGGDLSIYGGSSSFYYPAITAAGAASETIQLRALPTAATGTSSVSVSFKYDYVTDDTRNTVTSDQTLYIPLYQPDKMTFSVNVPTYDIYAGNEVYITLSYLNKGRADAANVKAELVGDVSALSTEKIIGNVLAGGNGSVDFIVTPYMAGEVSFSILLTYEDSNMNEVTQELPVTLNVMEMDWGGDDIYFPMTMEDSGEAEGGFPWWIVFVGGGVLLAAAVVVIIVVVHKKKKNGKKLTADDIDWEDELDEDNSDDTTKV